MRSDFHSAPVPLEKSDQQPLSIASIDRAIYFLPVHCLCPVQGMRENAATPDAAQVASHDCAHFSRGFGLLGNVWENK
jgi:hypothetical protein